MGADSGVVARGGGGWLWERTLPFLAPALGDGRREEEEESMGLEKADPPLTREGLV